MCPAAPLIEEHRPLVTARVDLRDRELVVLPATSVAARLADLHASSLAIVFAHNLVYCLGAALSPVGARRHSLREQIDLRLLLSHDTVEALEAVDQRSSGAIEDSLVPGTTGTEGLDPLQRFLIDALERVGDPRVDSVGSARHNPPSERVVSVLRLQAIHIDRHLQHAEQWVVAGVARPQARAHRMRITVVVIGEGGFPELVGAYAAARRKVRGRLADELPLAVVVVVHAEPREHRVAAVGLALLDQMLFAGRLVVDVFDGPHLGLVVLGDVSHPGLLHPPGKPVGLGQVVVELSLGGGLEGTVPRPGAAHVAVAVEIVALAGTKQVLRVPFGSEGRVAHGVRASRRLALARIGRKSVLVGPDARGLDVIEVRRPRRKRMLLPLVSRSHERVVRTDASIGVVPALLELRRPPSDRVRVERTRELVPHRSVLALYVARHERFGEAREGSRLAVKAARAIDVVRDVADIGSR